MKVAIMQPYFFPYIGYFQLIHAVDKFVIYDDVNYIKGGWINRNYIVSQGQKKWFSLQVKGGGSNVLINQVLTGSNKNKLLKTIRHSYSKASEFRFVFPVLEEIIMNEEGNLAKYLENSLKQVCQYLEINTEWLMSSDLIKDNALKGQEKIISICKELGASEYINLPGGRLLYEEEDFSQKGIKLSFIDGMQTQYKYFSNYIESNLSIVNLLMFNDVSECNKALTNYILK